MVQASDLDFAGLLPGLSHWMKTPGKIQCHYRDYITTVVWDLPGGARYCH